MILARFYKSLMYTIHSLISNYTFKKQNLLFQPWTECLPNMHMTLDLILITM